MVTISIYLTPKQIEWLDALTKTLNLKGRSETFQWFLDEACYPYIIDIIKILVQERKKRIGQNEWMERTW